MHVGEENNGISVSVKVLGPYEYLENIWIVYTVNWRFKSLFTKKDIPFFFLCFRYFLRVTIVKRLSDYVKEQDIIVHTLSQYPEMNSSIKMEVGIEDCLHIEFEYNKSK